VRRQDATPDLGVVDLIMQNCEGDLRNYQQRRDPMQRDGECLVPPASRIACPW
jgi:hypothetical protein